MGKEAEMISSSSGGPNETRRLRFTMDSRDDMSGIDGREDRVQQVGHGADIQH